MVPLALGITPLPVQTTRLLPAMAAWVGFRIEKVQMSAAYKSTSVTHRNRAGLTLTREVRWYRANRQAYRWSEQEARWVYLGHADSLAEAKHLASIDMHEAHRRDD